MMAASLLVRAALGRGQFEMQKENAGARYASHLRWPYDLRKQAGRWGCQKSLGKEKKKKMHVPVRINGAGIVTMQGQMEARRVNKQPFPESGFCFLYRPLQYVQCC